MKEKYKRIGKWEFGFGAGWSAVVLIPSIYVTIYEKKQGGVLGFIFLCFDFSIDYYSPADEN